MKKLKRIIEFAVYDVFDFLFPAPKYIFILFKDRFLFQHSIGCLAKQEEETLHLLQSDKCAVIAIMRPKP